MIAKRGRCPRCGQFCRLTGVWIVGGREYCDYRCAYLAADNALLSVGASRPMIEVLHNSEHPGDENDGWCSLCLGTVTTSPATHTC